jgi:integrase
MAQRIRGEGSVFWSASMRRFVGSYIIGRSADGRLKRKTFYGPRGDRSRIAKLGVVTRLDAFAAQRPRNASRETNVKYMRATIARLGIRARTAHGYGKLLERYVDGTPFGALPLCSVQAKDVRALLESITAGARTRQALRALLHRVYAAAVERDDLGVNPAGAVRVATPRRQRRAVWTPDEARAFLASARTSPYHAVFVLALTTGMGPAELFGLQRSSLHLDAGFLVVEHDLVEIDGRLALEPPKNAHRVRRIDLPNIAVDALRAHLERAPASEYVFTSPEGLPLRQSNFYRRVWQPLLGRSGLPKIRLYDLRHCANALWGYLGVPIQVARERLGHASIQQTVDTYGHLYRSQQVEVATKLDAFFDQDSGRPRSFMYRRVRRR